MHDGRGISLLSLKLRTSYNGLMTYWITVNGTHLSSWPTAADARRAMHALECMMNMSGRLTGKLAIEGPTVPARP